MDFPTAWKISRSKKFEEHDPLCSYRRFIGGFLCDCFVLNDAIASQEQYAGRIYNGTISTESITVQEKFNQFHNALIDTMIPFQRRLTFFDRARLTLLRFWERLRGLL